MWPWEHLALGYVLFSTTGRLGLVDRPGRAEAVAILVATQLPDVVDKPLAWTFDVLPSGISMAHSVFVAVPFAIAALLFGARYGATSVGIAAGVGYLSHLLGDLTYPAATGGSASPEYFLWPVVRIQGSVDAGGSIPKVVALLSRFGEFLATPRGVAYLSLEVAFLGFALAVWWSDGLPGVRRGHPSSM
jgi:hypothetical protein